ncbi:MAG: hypothetical protein J5J06_00790 [Phycisphaerae bacterium]|nr:hypothetical protein [Phycisphaerae bacterium]
MTSRFVCSILIASTAAWVVYAEGFHLFAIWNLLPLILATAAIWQRPHARRPRRSTLTFAAVTTILIALTHAAWVFDWRRTATGSSTAALFFIFIPALSVSFGAIGWVPVRAAEWLFDQRSKRRIREILNAGKVPCGRCKYPLLPNQDRCPECGTARPANLEVQWRAFIESGGSPPSATPLPHPKLGVDL